ncbi:MAG: hypothetical protein WD097_09780 [Balneolales bacterium]
MEQQTEILLQIIRTGKRGEGTTVLILEHRDELIEHLSRNYDEQLAGLLEEHLTDVKMPEYPSV